MARKKKELPLLEKVTITDVAAEGKAIAKVDDLVVFVPYVVPGDVVDLQVKRKKNKYAYVVAAIVKNKDFVSSSKQLKLNNPTNISDEIYNLAVNLIKEVWDPNGIRLVGIRVSSLVSNYYYQPNMFENNFKNEENLKLEKTIDAIKEKYGVNKISKGIK